MILCSCTRLTCRDLADAIDEALRETPEAPLTPNRLFLRSGRRIRCGACRGLVCRRIADHPACRDAAGPACADGALAAGALAAGAGRRDAAERQDRA